MIVLCSLSAFLYCSESQSREWCHPQWMDQVVLELTMIHLILPGLKVWTTIPSATKKTYFNKICLFLLYTHTHIILSIIYYLCI